MKKYLIIYVLQLLVFYGVPLICDDPMAMVLIILIATFLLSLILGFIDNNKKKYIYAVIVAITFLPSVFIFYNESALIHSLWYLVISTLGIKLGSINKKR